MDRKQVQAEALQILLDNERCTLEISMGVGKTRIGINHMLHFYNDFVQYLVIAPKKSIMQSWIDEAEKMDCSYLLDHITFSTYRSMCKHNPYDFDVVYLDECHSMTDTNRPFLEVYPGKIIGLTGTAPTRELSEKMILMDEFCPLKYTFTVDDATDSNILNDYKIIVHMLELDQLKRVKKKNKKGGHWFTSERADYNYQCNRYNEARTSHQRNMSAIMRMKSMMDYPTKELYVKSLLNKINSKCIVFANTKKQADSLCDHSYHSGNANSDHNLELFSDGRINTLSCVLQLSEGVNIPNLKQGIIMHAYGNNRKSAQRIGRLLRLNPDDTSLCHILCYKDTKDSEWVKKALKDFDQSKISIYDPLASNTVAKNQYNLGI